MSWEHRVLFFKFKTSTINSLMAADSAGDTISGFSIKFYDASDEELTTEGTISANTTKTVIDVEPQYDYHVWGGYFMQKSLPPMGTIAYVVGGPDIPAPTGTVEFFNRCDLSFFPLYFDFSNLEYISVTYDAENHSSLIRITIEHTAGLQHDMQVGFKIRK